MVVPPLVEQEAFAPEERPAEAEKPVVEAPQVAQEALHAFESAEAHGSATDLEEQVPAPAAAEVSAPAPEPQLTAEAPIPEPHDEPEPRSAAEEPAPPRRPEPVSTEIDPAQPKRAGWWSRAKASLGG